MSNLFRKMLAGLCSIAMLVSLPVLGFADDLDAETASGLDVIRATGDDRYIQLPKEENCLQTPVTRYVDVQNVLYQNASVGYSQMFHSAPVERKPTAKGGEQMPYVYQGTKVTVIAEETEKDRTYACILYLSSLYKLRAGWIWDIYLSDTDPAKPLTIGEENSAATGSIAEVPMSWSGVGFLNSQQYYSVLEEPVENCVGFTLEYQIIKENVEDELLWAILGPRTVYVYDGAQWIEAGTFEYPELGTVRVRVNLAEPTDIFAIGTIADCSQPNLFNFRQFAADYSVVA